MYIELLKQIDQKHIVQAYEHASPQHKKAFDEQIKKIQAAYPGGLKVYHSNALRLLKESAEGVNPYANFSIGKPQGLTFQYEDLATWEKYETIGLQQLQYTSFVLVAGGLGERLGYSGIKVSIPMELLTYKCFLKYYCQYILAYEAKYCSGKTIPFAIMTSEDTNQKTIQLLESNNYFGLQKNQVTLLCQQKVPALVDNDAHFSLIPGKCLLETKPHGHGDIHTLLHLSGLAKKWKQEGRKWITVFQDTNPFALKSFPLLLGISSGFDYDFNTLGVSRKPGEAVGAITTLVNKQNGKILTINIQYNQVEAAFKANGGEPTTPDGYSQFPGNTNCFAIKISTYVEVLEKTQGLISEFINPKYSDATKTKFKSATRLECMMQDYPKLLPNCDKVGFANIPKGYCFSAMKNDLASANAKHKQGLSGQGAPHCEAEIYINNRVLLRLCGAQIEQGKPINAGGSELAMFPMISFSPFFATCLTELRHKVKKLWVHPKSSLLIESDCVLENVEIDGHFEIKDTGSIVLKHLSKDYHRLVELQGNEDPYLLIRGYKMHKHQDETHLKKEHPSKPVEHTKKHEEIPVKHQTHPVKHEVHPVKHEDHPVKKEQHVVKKEEHAVKKEEHLTKQVHPEKHELHPKVQEHPAKQQSHPAKTQAHPVKTETHPVKHEVHPVKHQQHKPSQHPVKHETHPAKHAQPIKQKHGSDEKKEQVKAEIKTEAEHHDIPKKDDHPLKP